MSGRVCKQASADVKDQAKSRETSEFPGSSTVEFSAQNPRKKFKILCHCVRLTYRQTGGQTDRHTDRKTDRNSHLLRS